MGGSSSREIVGQAGKIVMYDIGFCLYIFFFFGAAGFCCYGMVATLDCDGSTGGFVACLLLVIYAFITWNFSFCWYCCQCICGGIETTKEQTPLPSLPDRPHVRNIIGTVLGRRS